MFHSGLLMHCALALLGAPTSGSLGSLGEPYGASLLGWGLGLAAATTALRVLEKCAERSNHPLRGGASGHRVRLINARCQGVGNCCQHCTSSAEDRMDPLDPWRGAPRQAATNTPETRPYYRRYACFNPIHHAARGLLL